MTDIERESVVLSQAASVASLPTVNSFAENKEHLTHTEGQEKQL
jgi:hypothetical protein